MAKKSQKASALPLVGAVIAIAISIGLYILTLHTAHAFALHLIGYILTPLVVALCMAWDSIDQRRKITTQSRFERKKTYTKILRALLIVSFVTSFPHIFAMATDIAEKFAR